MAGEYRCQKREDGTGRQCVLAVRHVGFVKCKFDNDAAAKAVAGMTPTALALAADKQPRMNKTETRYSVILEARRLAGEIRDWKFEALTFKLADGVRYKADFYVEMADRSIQIHEVKGAFIWEDARVKVRVAAATFTAFKFYMAQWKKGEWHITEIRV